MGEDDGAVDGAIVTGGETGAVGSGRPEPSPGVGDIDLGLIGVFGGSPEPGESLADEEPLPPFPPLHAASAIQMASAKNSSAALALMVVLQIM